MQLVEAVRKSILEGRLLEAGQTVVAAVSGGADSLCLLHVLWSLRKDLDVSLHVAHLDHGLRGEDSAADAAFVAEFAASLGLPATVERRDVRGHRVRHGLTLEEAAREVRYDFLAEVAGQAGAAAVATGHTADDNVETIVLHWLRGAGLAGMRGILPSRPLAATGLAAAGDGEPGVPAAPVSVPLLVRPLLRVTRFDTEDYCRRHGLAFRQDATNAETTSARNRIRLDLLPELERCNPRLRETLLRAALASAGDHAYLREQTLSAWASVAGVGQDGVMSLDRAAFRPLHPAIQRGILREALERLWGGWQDFGWVHVEDLRRAALAGPVGGQVHLPHGLAAVVGYTCLRIGRGAALAGRPEGDEGLPSVSGGPMRVAVPGVTTIPGTPWELVVEAAAPDRVAPRGCALVDADAIGGGVELRGPLPGDRLQPRGMSGTKKLQDLFVDAKIPRGLRGGLPVLACERGIFWVAGRWSAGWAAPGPGTQGAWLFSFRRAGQAR